MNARLAASGALLPVLLLFGGCGDEATSSRPPPAAVDATAAESTVAAGSATVVEPPSIDCAALPVDDVEAIVRLGLVSGRRTIEIDDPTLLPDSVVRSTSCSYDTDALGGVVSVVVFDAADAVAAAGLAGALEAEYRSSVGADGSVERIDAGEQAVVSRRDAFLTVAVAAGSRVVVLTADAALADAPLTEAQVQQLVELVLARLLTAGDGG